MSSTRNPNAGQKVSSPPFHHHPYHPLNKPPKVTSSTAAAKTEGVGSLAADSLASDSIRAAGAFASNPHATPSAEATTNPHASAPGTRSSGKQGLENQESYGGAAPSYVDSQFAVRDGSGPHGRNLTEGEFAGSGTAGGRMPEPGSKEDPAREGMRKIRGEGGGGVEMDEHPYGVLKDKAL
ncbi:hypothetical protein B0H67DRAFT_685866 [Lasiosphaeris hirsuta]|uniref:Uncharacterized protein n=1 Tax=Lasiosphaeris hirsuta TaxID=260670 RepID=A0AA40A1J4_9PEZI|nr:hypothetical protein B0H67DRAFT_685866 [Lasiosphaeris hirsuta]